MVPLEWAARAAGHEVRVASAPSLVEAITASGLPAVSVGSAVDLGREARRSRDLVAWHDHDRWPAGWPVQPELLDEKRLGLLAALGRRQFALAGNMLDDLVAFARDWRPDLVVHDAVSYAGPVVASVLGVPNISHLWGSPGLQRLEMKGLGDEPQDGYVQLYERFGAPVRTWPQAWVDPCPPLMGFGAVESVRTMQYVPYNGPGAMPDRLLDRPRRPRVCVTWGATTARLLGAEMADLLRQAVEAVAALPVEVVLTTTADQRELLDDLPPSVRTEVSVPLHMLLPTCTAVVHHGGAGTTLTAARLGLPQLTVTRRPEPTLNGERQASTGAGIHLTYGELSRAADPVKEIREQVARLLDDPSYRDAALRLADDMRRVPPPAEIVTALEGVARR
ncbi:nucleotide disphospho-sugar-binding domain-containing protein [Streptomyces minutiscleroticus]|uniref:Glycosyltransferase n=1 Tax=Streptomyces roseiscleroticus TaxID=1972 RepID=A0A2Z5E4P4_9ACTN|nr:glycosyltransferase [Streptomyces roseiscleroticus]